MMNNYQYIKKITLEANKPFVQPPEIELDRAYSTEQIFLEKEDTFHSLYRVEKVTIEPFFLCDWSMKIETGFSEEYLKVADIVGHDKAIEILKVLGL